MPQTIELPSAPESTAPAAKPFRAPDLTQRPPRSPRQRLGGFVILPRTLDKGRAKLAGKIGEYHWACPVDKRFLNFVGIEADALLQQLEAGKGDGEILAWLHENARHPRTGWEIAAWSDFQERKTADSAKSKERAARQLAAINPERNDIVSGFDLLDLDDHVTFGGKP
jgi:hypothetical protein